MPTAKNPSKKKKSEKAEQEILKRRNKHIKSHLSSQIILCSPNYIFRSYIFCMIRKENKYAFKQG